MASSQEKMITDRVKNVAKTEGFQIAVGGKRSPFGGLGWFQNSKFVPDLVLKRGNSIAIVEIKTRPVVTHDVFQIKKMLSRKNTIGALICVPDSSYYHTAPSVRDYANDLNVGICSFSDVESALKGLLEKPQRKSPTLGA